MKKIVAGLLAMVILCSNFCYAMPSLKKKETVYVNLESYGNVEEINIYSKCDVNGATEIKDYTKYSQITNLSNRKLPISESGETTWNVSGDSNFSYTGKVSNEYYESLPWNFEIIYKLNGVETVPSQLLGASGLIEIIIKVNSNEKANDYYKNNFILEITATYDMSEYLSVESDNAMITDTGNSKTLMFIVLPGQSTEFNIKLGSDDFSMDGLTMAAVPLAGDILTEISNLVDDKDDIKNSLDSIDTSTDVILNALNGMNIGLNGIENGVLTIKNGTQELHSISNLRDEDVQNLKNILEELLPIIENIKVNVDNLNNNYETFIKMFENLDAEVKELQDDVEELNDEFDKIVDITKNLPNDVKDIKDTIDTIAKLTGDISSLIKSLDDDETASDVKENLVSLNTEARKLAKYAQNCEDENPELALSLVTSAQEIGTVAINIKTIFESVSLSQIQGKSILSTDLEDLEKDLKDVSDILSKDDAKTIRNFISDLNATIDTLEDMLETVSDYNDELLKNKNDVTLMIDNAKQLVDELSKMNTLSLSMITNIQNMLSILSGNIYDGTNQTLDAISSLNKQLLNITSQSNQFKNSKNQIKDVMDSKWDEIEDETTLFNVDKNAKVVSFGSEKNENIESVQFMFKTPDIKAVKEPEKDLEANNIKLSFWDRVLLVFEKMFGWIKNIFKN